MTDQASQAQQELQNPFTEIGSSNFEKFAASKTAIFVDKTQFIKEIINSKDVTLITRPRRWGKTLNMSMLKYFFSINTNADCSIDNISYLEKRDILSKMSIGKHRNIMDEYCGKYPTIFVSLKNIKATSFEEIQRKVASLMFDLYFAHKYLLHSTVLDDEDKALFRRYLEKYIAPEDIEKAIKRLSGMMYKHFGKSVVVLIDEYDAPINDWYARKLSSGDKIDSEHDEHLQQVLSLFREIFSEALKDNEFLYKGVVTGVLRVAKANLFSGLNNFTEDSILDNHYSNYFGFTEEEVNDLVHKTDLDYDQNTLDAMRSWYNGYNIGSITIYNPWSIMNWLSFKGQFKAYWVGTASTMLLEKAFILDTFQEEVQRLIEGEAVNMIANPYMVLSEITASHNAFYNLLLFSGYLTICTVKQGLGGTYNCKVRIPNREVLEIFQMSVVQWLEKAFKLQAGQYHEFAMHLLSGDIEQFSGSLKYYLETSSSYFDSGEIAAETLYNGFMLGIFASSIVADYYVEKERETGKGRADLLIIPKASAPYDIAFILEYKIGTKKEDLSSIASGALDQIKAKNYISKIRTYDKVRRVIGIGLAFYGKDLEIVASELPFKS